MSNLLIGLLAAILIVAITAGAIGGCVRRAHDVAEYNRANQQQ